MKAIGLYTMPEVIIFLNPAKLYQGKFVCLTLRRKGVFSPSEFIYLILSRNLVFPETLFLSVEAGTLNSLLKESKSSFTQFLSGKLMVRDEISKSNNLIAFLIIKQQKI